MYPGRNTTGALRVIRFMAMATATAMATAKLTTAKLTTRYSFH